MKIVLVYPRLNYLLVSGALEPLGIQYIASALKKDGEEVEIIDFTFNSDMERLRRSVDGADYVGFSFTTPLFNKALEILKYIRSFNKDIVAVAGGPHPTLDHVSVLDNGFDYAVIGEGESVIREFNKFVRLGTPEKTTGVAYKKDGKPVVNAPAPLTKNLDELPFPSRELVDYSAYDSMGMVASRGCRYNCLYCQPNLRRIFGNEVRERGIGNIVEEIDRISHAYPNKRIRFEDDTFTMHDAAWFERFRSELKKRKLKIRWQCNSRVDTIDAAKARIMKECGCSQIGFGVESGSKKILDFYRKGTTPEKAKEAFRDMRKAGIMSHAFIMLGAPVETREDLDATYELIKAMRPDKLITYNVTPLPGSDLFNYCKKENILDVREFEEYDNSVNSYKGVFPIKLKFLKEEDITRIKKKIDFYILTRSIFNVKILRVLITEPRRIFRAFNLYVKKYIARKA